ncbi:hypothetical protein G6F43_008975 [Rhizopus delemar]|nr:hypothetical protein G6F43_008975 [Rhizopus delemar]
MFAVRNQLCSISKRAFATVTSTSPKVDQKFRVVVVGGGPGGLSVSSTISNLLGKNQVAVIEPSNKHYYQPLWTYVGSGLKDFNESFKPMAEVMPTNAEWIQDKVTTFDPENNTLRLADGQTVGYDYLVVAAGIQVNWDNIKGLKEALGKDGVTSNYDIDSVQKTYKFLQEFKGGNALFTFPTTPLKCPGAPTKITFLAEEVFRLTGVRDKTNVIYNHGGTQIFGIEYFAHAIEKLADERGIKRNFLHELVEINADNHQAIFKDNSKNGELKTFEYDFIHVAPPQGPPDFIKESKLADANGWVDVNKDTLRHNKYNNIFALGDCSSLPTSKTAAAITGESGVLKHNLIADLQGKKVEQAVYDGYSSCPMILSRDRLILTEYSGYTSKPLETFPFDQRKLSKVSQYMNKEIIPFIYWNGLLTGNWVGPSTARKMFDVIRPKRY